MVSYPPSVNIYRALNNVDSQKTPRRTSDITKGVAFNFTWSFRPHEIATIIIDAMMPQWEDRYSDVTLSIVYHYDIHHSMWLIKQTLSYCGGLSAAGLVANGVEKKFNFINKSFSWEIFGDLLFIGKHISIHHCFKSNWVFGRGR